ncbi:hypothetical protein FHG64_16075 [Antarcticibacterium flavum]|uniref:Uncharacterized protein n=1 Tax=Antarcticibacterium flavum TaxID=2058175 RepID=A0A5B7X5R3_9FLAO|nr:MULTISPECIES: hypothetical protein [Antarcticibacterium]MCM4159533.1 hypothetical protein [Antarcticibacterium sp. W02-3]QCY70786.1 hypothetical protein FHG64_16075 [Antarcticibacterium flavum]
MTSKEFKTAISEAKEVLKGKTLIIKFVNGGKIQKLSFSTLKGFGNAILALEKLGAGFGFVKAGNQFVQRGIYKPSEFQTVLTRGVWNEITFLATTVK